MSHAADILATLDPRELEERLDEIEAERKALLVLIRSARARERAISRRRNPDQEGRADG